MGNSACQSPVITELQAAFSQAADPVTAQGQQRYMKSVIPFWGIPSARRKQLSKVIFREHIPKTNQEYRQTARRIFMEAEHREEWYAAIDFACQFRHFICVENIDIYLDFIYVGQWWDIVDGVSSWLIGEALLGSPLLPVKLHKWIADENMWIRRTALLAQLKYKEQTDFTLLSELMLSVCHEKEFFIRKAIGWALRQYSYTNPDAVISFVNLHNERLSKLSTSEALKVIHRKSRTP